jgi:hypothetical protein
MRSTGGHAGKGLSLARGLFLVFGYVIASSILGLAVAVATIHALYPGVAEWRRPAVVAGLSLAVIVVCWLTMPANRPHVGVLILRVEMVVCLAVGVFVAGRLLFGRSPVVGGDVFILIVTAAGFVIGLCIAGGTRWGRKWAR